MKLSVELYPEAGNRCSHVMPVGGLIRSAILELLDHPIPEMRYLLQLTPVPEYPNPKASVINLAPDYGYAILHVFDRHMHLHYRHPHSLDELLAKPLARRLRRDYPEQDRWGYRLVGSELGELPMDRQTPRVEGLDYNRTRGAERARFRIRKLEEEPPPLLEPAELGIHTRATTTAPVSVVLDAELHTHLLHELQLSNEVEEGGFLLGRVYRDRQDEEHYIACLDRTPKAEHSGASLLHFTFTGDSFAAVRRQLPADRTAQRLLGWYHTHLFPVREEMGLSTIDVDLHNTTFRQPWQLAGLLNLEKDGRRILRFYVRSERGMERCPYYILPHETGGQVEVKR